MIKGAAAAGAGSTLESNVALVLKKYSLVICFNLYKHPDI